MPSDVGDYGQGGSRAAAGPGPVPGSDYRLSWADVGKPELAREVARGFIEADREFQAFRASEWPRRRERASTTVSLIQG